MILLADINYPGSQEDLVSNWKPARSLVEDAISGAEFAPCLPALAITCLPASLPPAGDGPVRSSLALLWYLLSPLFCEQARQCLRLEIFIGKFSLSLSCFFVFFFFFPSLAIPTFGLLSHVSSLRLPSGHSGLVLTLSNAPRASLFSPCLLMVDVSIWAISLLGVAIRHVICGFYLFIPPGFVTI